jgi:hypothetical protein
VKKTARRRGAGHEARHPITCKFMHANLRVRSGRDNVHSSVPVHGVEPARTRDSSTEGDTMAPKKKTATKKIAAKKPAAKKAAKKTTRKAK